MKRLSLIFLLFLSLINSVDLLEAEDSPCSLVPESLKTVEEIRGLKIKNKVPCFAKQKDAVRTHLVEMVREKIPQERLAIEGQSLKAVGFLPKSFDYEKGLIDLYVSQLGGYYDPEAKYFVMAAWMPMLLQSSVAVHELTHAVQDQHYALDKFVDQKIENSDLLLARSALIEGDATAVMMDAVNIKAGLPRMIEMDGVESIITQNILGASLSGAMSGVPNSLQVMVLFPYSSGLRFAHYLLKRGGYPEIDKAFARSPRSTEEILHPEQYFNDQPGFRLIAPEEVIDKGWGEVIFKDTLGEFMLSALLSNISSAKIRNAQAAAGWGGDTLVVQKSLTKPSEKLLSWKIEWDSSVDNLEFMKIYAPYLKEREQSGENISVAQDDKSVLIRIELK